MQVQPYLLFDGRCEEALEFYSRALDAKIEAMLRFGDNPDPASCMPGMPAEKVMHSCVRVGDTSIMASDGQCPEKPGFRGFSLTLRAADDADARRRFEALAEGGEVQMPLGETFFASSFGMVADKFGVSWSIVANPKDVR